MFKKILFLYGAMLFFLALVFLMFLIGFRVHDVSQRFFKKTIKTVVVPQTNLLENTKLKISTDKKIYSFKEKVVINLENRAQAKMLQKNKPSLEIRARADIGDNNEVAFIEYFNQGKWLAIEPVHRCSGDCRQACSRKKQIAAHDKNEFIWPQTLLTCLANGETKISNAPKGQYRIISAVWDKQNNQFIKVYSDIFTISDLSLK